jgi:hypothetical protein
MQIQTKKDPEHALNFDVVELKSFVAATMFMTIMKKPKLSLYWTTLKMFATPGFAKMMSRNKFFSILRNISFNDEKLSLKSRIIPKDDNPLAKVRPLLLYLKNKWQCYYYPGTGIVIDESMLSHKGTLFFKQYLPKKD